MRGRGKLVAHSILPGPSPQQIVELEAVERGAPGLIGEGTRGNALRSSAR
jgi:hypothetical protein